VANLDVMLALMDFHEEKGFSPNKFEDEPFKLLLHLFNIYEF